MCSRSPSPPGPRASCAAGCASSTGRLAAGWSQVQARTFHAAALRQLTHFWPVTVGGLPPAVLDSKIGLLAEAARAARRACHRPGTARPGRRGRMGQGDAGAAGGLSPAAAARHGRTPPVGHEAAGRVFAAYERLRRERHLVDFESVLELTAAILAGHRRRPPRCATGTATSSWTSSRTSTRCRSCCSTSGPATGTSVRGR